MSPAFKKVIYSVTGAGLLAAAMTCTAANDVTASPPTEISSTVATSVAATSSPVGASPVSTVQNPNEASVSAAPQNDAQTPANNTNPYYKNANSPPIGSGGHLLNVTLGLLLVIGLIFGLSWFVKRFSQGNLSGTSHLKIIATMPLGTRERIVLIDAGGQQLLLGITPTHINTLHTFDTPIAANSADINTSDFGRKLMAILQRPSDADDQSNGNNNSEKRE